MRTGRTKSQIIEISSALKIQLETLLMVVRSCFLQSTTKTDAYPTQYQLMAQKREAIKIWIDTTKRNVQFSLL